MPITFRCSKSLQKCLGKIADCWLHSSCLNGPPATTNHICCVIACYLVNTESYKFNFFPSSKSIELVWKYLIIFIYHMWKYLYLIILFFFSGKMFLVNLIKFNGRYLATNWIFQPKIMLLTEENVNKRELIKIVFSFPFISRMR